MADDKKQYPIRINLETGKREPIPARRANPVRSGAVRGATQAAVRQAPLLAAATGAVIDYLRGSGGEMPKPTQAKAAVPKRAPAVKSRPNDPNTLYSQFNASLIKAMMGEGKVSLRQMGALAGTVPQAPKPMSPVEAAQMQYLSSVNQEYDTAMALAQQMGDPEREIQLDRDRRAALFNLFDPANAALALQMQNEDD